MSIKASEYKYDTPNLLPESRKYFRDFWNTNRRDEYYHAYKGYRFGYNTGYSYFYRSDEVEQVMRDIYLNLTETFGNVTIPGEFATEFNLVLSWFNFREYLNSKDELFTIILNYYSDTKEYADEIEKMFADRLPEPFYNIEIIKEEVKRVLNKILQMDETQEYLTEIEIYLKRRR